MLNLVLDSNTIDTLSQQLYPLYQKIQEHEENLYHYPFDKLIEDLKKQTKLLFVDVKDDLVESFAVLDFTKYGESHSVRILYSAGKLTEDWSTYIEFFEHFAKQFNIDFIEVWGRPGWGKILKNHGFGTKVVNYVKKVH